MEDFQLDWRLEDTQDPYRIEVPVQPRDAKLNKQLALDKRASVAGPLPSPAAILDEHASSTQFGSTCTVSQPNSSTSSLASLVQDTDLQVASRVSSGSDLGARPSLSALLPAGDPQPLTPVRSNPAVLKLLESFDLSKLTSLTRIKTRSAPSSARVLRAPPPPPCCLVSPFISQPTNKVAPDNPVKGSGVRIPTFVHHTRTASAGTYNPYDLAGALADFSRSTSIKSPQPRGLMRTLSGSSHASTTVAPRLAPTWSCSEDEPDCIVMIPGCGVHRKTSKHLAASHA